MTGPARGARAELTGLLSPRIDIDADWGSEGLPIKYDPAWRRVTKVEEQPMPPRAYAAEQRADLVRLVLDEGMAQTDAARRVGIRPESAPYYVGQERKRRAAGPQPPAEERLPANPLEAVADGQGSGGSGSVALRREVRMYEDPATEEYVLEVGHKLLPRSIRRDPIPRAIRLLSVPEVLEVLRLPADDLDALRRVAAMA